MRVSVEFAGEYFHLSWLFLQHVFMKPFNLPHGRPGNKQGGLPPPTHTPFFFFFFFLFFVFIQVIRFSVPFTRVRVETVAIDPFTTATAVTDFASTAGAA